MRLSDKLRNLRGVEGALRDLGRPMTQGELVRALKEELGESLSQSYLSQIESGTRPHLTNTSRQLLARFFKVHPGFLVDDPDGFHAELMSDLRHETADSRLDVWLTVGAEQFSGDPELSQALRVIADHEDSRGCLLLLQSLLQLPEFADRLPEGSPSAGPAPQAEHQVSEAGLEAGSAPLGNLPRRTEGDRL